MIWTLVNQVYCQGSAKSSGTRLSFHFTLSHGFHTMETFIPAYNKSTIFNSQFPFFAPRELKEFCQLQSLGDLPSYSIHNDEEHHHVISKIETMAFSKQFSNQMLIAGGRSSNRKGGQTSLQLCIISLYAEITSFFTCSFLFFSCNTSS